ncbi:MAG: D-glycero-beta-D-manno-heptose 1-phosphate adenylyltransferase [Bacteroidales bacterium]|nr:D-glycero-beta-D-manno-heptose 1-phosphate adenylyltransferase [Bacteroidales bacterium]
MQNLTFIQQKILSSNSLSTTLEKWRNRQQKIVFTNGCFDILHVGHVEYVAQAKEKGDVLIVGLNSDDSVRRLKGESRPINPQKARAELLAALFFVDAVVIFEEDTPYNLIKIVQPDVLIKGADYQPETVVGYDIVTAKGGKVETIALIEGYSTTNIVHKIHS